MTKYPNQGPTSRAQLAESNWPSPTGRVQLAESNWPSPTGRAQLAEPNWPRTKLNIENPSSRPPEQVPVPARGCSAGSASLTPATPAPLSSPPPSGVLSAGPPLRPRHAHRRVSPRRPAFVPHPIPSPAALARGPRPALPWPHWLARPSPCWRVNM